jgi:K+/H+ antiporter YhaU regulatory subunit KhtT
VANVLLRPVVADFLDQVLHSTEMDVDMKSVKVDVGSPLAGSTLGDLQMREKCGASVVAILGPDGVYHTSPRGDEVVKEGDELIVMGTPQQLHQLEHLYCGLPEQ